MFERLIRLASFHFDVSESILIDAKGIENEESEQGLETLAKKQFKKIDVLAAYLENGDQFGFFSLYSGIAEALSKIADRGIKLEFYYSLSAVFISYLNRWSLFQQIQAEGPLHQTLQLESASWEAIIDYFKHMAEAIFTHKIVDLQDRQSDLIKHIHRYVDMNLANDLSLSSIAEKVGHSPSYLSRLYKQMTGRNLSDHMMETRLKKARQLLTDSTLKIHDVSRAVGFASEVSFYRFFKKAMGLTPHEYRDSARRRAGNHKIG